MKSFKEPPKLRLMKTTITPSNPSMRTSPISKTIQDVINRPRQLVSIVPSLVLRQRRASMSPRYNKKLIDPLLQYKPTIKIGHRLL